MENLINIKLQAKAQSKRKMKKDERYKKSAGLDIYKVALLYS